MLPGVNHTHRGQFLIPLVPHLAQYRIKKIDNFYVIARDIDNFALC
jgi:hypothetical protein